MTDALEEIMIHIKNKRGQSTVEYVLLVTAVLAVIIAFVAGNNNVFQSQLCGTLNSVTQDINDLGTRLTSSHAATGEINGTDSPVVVLVNNGVGD
jgi:hypothetical protein